MLLTERGLGGNDPDLELRWRRWRSDKSPRAEAARKLAARMARAASTLAAGRVDEHDLAKPSPSPFPTASRAAAIRPGESWQSVGGRGFRLDPASPLAGSQWLAVGEVAGHASGARILSAAAIDEQAVLDLFGDRIETRHDGDFDPATGSVTPTRSRRLGAIRLSSGPDPKPDAASDRDALLEGVREHGLGLLPWDERGVAAPRPRGFRASPRPEIPPLDDEASARSRRRMARALAQRQAAARRHCARAPWHRPLKA